MDLEAPPVALRAFRYQQHSDAEKAHALIKLAVNNDNIAKTARELGIPRTTLSDWAEGRKINAHVTELRQSGGAQIAEKLEEMTQEILDEIHLRSSRAPFVHLARCAAKLIDIALRLRGCTCGRAPRL